MPLAGELPKFIFPTLEDIYYLKHNQRDRIKSSLMKGFKSIDDLQKDAEFTENITSCEDDQGKEWITDQCWVYAAVLKICQSFEDVPKCIELVNKNGVMSRDISDAGLCS